MFSTEKKNQSTVEKLIEAKEKARIIATDFDGTIVVTEDDYCDCLKLIQEILECGYIFAIITARHATFLLEFVPKLQDILRKSKLTFPYVYLGTGNGSNLYKITGESCESLYRFVLTENEISQIIRFYLSLNLETPCSGWNRWMADAHFTKWNGIISDDHFNISKATTGVWVEDCKVSVALEEEPSLREKHIEKFKSELSKYFHVACGGDTSIDITPKLNFDSKLHAAKEILSIENLSSDAIVTFGDRPKGNDALLLQLPFGFTNDLSFEQRDSNPPYLLHEGSIEAVHQSIRFIIS
ncbi:MAG: HAD hydrolase family protein [Symploca sp. SIO2E9]|nr:HAD hydrolase family protein [Symploca sp. SIO2E9]